MILEENECLSLMGGVIFLWIVLIKWEQLFPKIKIIIVTSMPECT